MQSNRFTKKILNVFLSLFCIINSIAQEAPYTIDLVHFSTPNFGSRGYQTLNDVDTNSCLGKYGGWLEQNVGATGFYHTKKIDSNWYVVDPEGYVFYTIGITSVQRGGGLDLPADLKNIGINTMGNWSDESIPDIPFCPRMGFISSYKNTSEFLNTLFHDHTFPVFGEEFASFVDREAQAFVEPYIGNPWVYGYHTDNEINFHHVDINKYLALPPSDPNYKGAYDWMIERRGSIAIITEEDISDFRGYVAETYMSTVNNALKRYDPDHMNIGSRVHSISKFDEKIIAGIGRNVDIMSINYYGRWNIDDVHMDMWIDTGGAPFLISEFYAKSQESGHPNSSGAGWDVFTLADRVSYFENMALRLLSHRGSIGWTLFRYIEGDNINNGLLKKDYTFYEGLAEATHNISRDVYNLRRFLLDEDLIESTCQETPLVNDESLVEIEEIEEIIPVIEETEVTSRIVHITKRNAPNFALDGNFGAENEQNIYLWNADENNVNQQWIEIDRGDGYFTYQKMGTNFALNADYDGSNNQNAYLFTINENNQNQHWQKLDVGEGAFKLIKRNAPELALDGGNDGARAQNVQLSDSSSSSQNLHWVITPIGEVVTNSSSFEFEDNTTISSLNKIIIYPNPVISTATIVGAENSTITIFDISGTLVLTKDIISENEEMDLNFLSPGVYLIRVINSEKSTFLKFVKQ